MRSRRLTSVQPTCRTRRVSDRLTCRARLLKLLGRAAEQPPRTVHPVRATRDALLHAANPQAKSSPSFSAGPRSPLALSSRNRCAEMPGDGASSPVSPTSLRGTTPAGPPPGATPAPHLQLCTMPPKLQKSPASPPRSRLQRPLPARASRALGGAGRAEAHRAEHGPGVGTIIFVPFPFPFPLRPPIPFIPRRSPSPSLSSPPLPLALPRRS